MKYTAINIPSLERIAKAIEKQIELQEKVVKQNEKLVKVQERILEMYDDAKRMTIECHNKDEKELKALMQSPKYWRDQDPETVKRVEECFKRLYG